MKCAKRRTPLEAAYLLGFLLKLLDCSLVDSAAFVDQMASCSGLARVYVADNDDVDMNLFLNHCFRWKFLLWFDEMFLLEKSQISVVHSQRKNLRPNSTCKVTTNLLPFKSSVTTFSENFSESSQHHVLNSCANLSEGSKESDFQFFTAAFQIKVPW